MNEDIEIVDLDVDDDFGFEDEDFETDDHHGHKVKRGRRKSIIHYVLLGLALLIIVFVVYRVAKWNKGVASDYDPDEVTTEFDVEPNDYIQPMSADQLKDKVDDGKTTIVTIGNSPFADDGENNNLAKALGEVYGAEVYNVGFADSYITSRQKEYISDNPEDGVSLYQVAQAIGTGNYDVVKDAAGRMSDEAVATADRLAGIDFTAVDTIFIMYNLEDYRDHRPLGSEDKEDVTCIYGAIYSSVAAIQDKYPYIRIVMLSQPAGGVTIDNFFVDGDIHDIGCGTLTEYINFETSAIAARGASFVDVYYGAINVDDRDKYLKDDYHINDEGAKAIADRVKKLIP